MKKYSFTKRITIVLLVLLLPALGWVIAQQGGGFGFGAETADMTGLPQTKQEKIEYFQQLRQDCLQQGNTSAVAYCDWAIGFLQQ